MTEEILFEKVNKWATEAGLQLDKLSTEHETKLANGASTYAGTPQHYACLSKDDETYKTLVFSRRSLMVFAFEVSIITGEEAMELDGDFIIPPPREMPKI